MNNLIFPRFLRKRFIKPLLIGFITTLVALNGMAWMHARAMTHFVNGGNRTGKTIFENLAGEKSLRTFDVGHEMISVARSEEWRAEVSDFLKRLSPRDRRLEYRL